MGLTNLSFLFIFSPIFFTIFFVIPWKNIRRLILFLGSVIFYSWGEPKFIFILFAQIIINFFLARLITYFENKYALKRFFLVIGLTVNLSLLVFLKEFKTLLSLFGESTQLPLFISEIFFPLGISFIIFSSISYLLDVSFKEIPAEKNILTYSNFILFFPKIIQGPIWEFKKFKQDYEQPIISISNSETGIKRFIIGLSKKVLLADSIGVVADKVFAADYGDLGLGLSWYGLIAFALQIYFDFSGYTDMAIGIGKIIGFNMPENFNFPYFSTSIADFWRRWHMTLTAWFRKYVFLPLEFQNRKIKFFRLQISLIIVFFLTGLWHGATPNYLIWGVFFGFLLALESTRWGNLLKKFPMITQRLYSLFLILMGWVFFRIKNINQWLPFLKALFGFNGWTGMVNTRTLNILAYFPVLIIGIICCIPLRQYIPKKLDPIIDNEITETLVYLALFITSISFLIGKGYQAFLYQQF
jgi:alginate O-acetyltransferase complex protein AlgI